MKLLINVKDDKEHILDIGLRPDNEVYQGCEVVKTSRAAFRRGARGEWTLLGDQDQILDTVRVNLQRILLTMPDDWGCVTGKTTSYVRDLAINLATKAWVGVVCFDGRNYHMLSDLDEDARDQFLLRAQEEDATLAS